MRIVVVGGGFAGLSAAYHLAREGHDVVVLEAARAGSGASGRNTGMLGPGAGGTILEVRRRLGDEGARRLFLETQAAVERVIAMVRELGIDCDLELTGQLVLARSEAQARALEAQARAFAALGIPVEFSSTVPLATRAYVGALRFERAGILDPGKLVRGLKRAAIEAGAEVREETPVVAVRPGVKVVLAGGEVEADLAVVATDGLAARLGLLRGEVVPLHTHVIETAPVDVAALGWRGREGVLDARRFFSYFRLTADDRIRMGGGAPLYRAGRDAHAGVPEATRPATWDELARELVATFPQLEGVAIERRWSGPMGFTLDRLPVVGEVAPGVIYSGGWCGHGVALATASGATVADLVARRRVAATWARRSAPRVPPDPLRRVGLELYLWRLALEDRLSEKGVPA